MTEHHVRRGRQWLLATGGLAAAALIIVGIFGLTGSFDTAPRDLKGNPVTYDPGVFPVPAASATPSGSGRFIALSVGLDVPLGSLNAVGGVVTPPGFTSAYLIRNFGVTPAHAGVGAVYVVTHSLRNGAVGPGNALIDVTNKRARIATGATITVDDVDYRVTGSQNISKQQLPSSKIWAAGKNTLIVITCLQRPQGGPSVDNVVVTATRTP